MDVSGKSEDLDISVLIYLIGEAIYDYKPFVVIESMWNGPPPMNQKWLIGEMFKIFFLTTLQ